VTRFYLLTRLVIGLLVLRGRRDRSKMSRFSCCAIKSPYCNARSHVRVSNLWVPKTRPGMLSRRFARRDRIRAGADTT
jgi:hypothetical protein